MFGHRIPISLNVLDAADDAGMKDTGEAQSFGSLTADTWPLCRVSWGLTGPYCRPVEIHAPGHEIARDRNILPTNPSERINILRAAHDAGMKDTAIP